MKVKYSSFLGILVALVLVASFVVPARLMSPEPVSAAAEQSKMQWWPVDTPDTALGQIGNIYSPIVSGTEAGSELVKLLVGSNGNNMWVIYTRSPSGGKPGTPTPPSTNAAQWSMSRFMFSPNGGRSWIGPQYNNLIRDWLNADEPGPSPKVVVWDMAIAPDNPAVVVVAVSYVGGTYGKDNVAFTPAGENITTQRVFLSMDNGNNWDNTQWPPTATAPSGSGVSAYVSCLDISMDYGARSILVGVRNGNDGTAPVNDNKLWTMKMPGYGGWNVQNSTNGTPTSTNPFQGDIIAAEFSPTFNGDSTIAVLYSGFTGLAPAANTRGTFLVTGVHDIAKNSTTWQPSGTHVEIKRPTDGPGASPDINEIITGMIQMPSDFSGQSASLRRFYISTDAIDINRQPNDPNDGSCVRGVFRVDDNVVYCLMDNTATFYTAAQNITSRRAASIAYWGTYASGKLLVGERLGQACMAAVPVWFTDSPTVCPVPCWYPAKKPPTGAAGQTNCTANTQGFGNAYVVWSPTFAAQGVAYAVTGSMSYDGPWAAYTEQKPVLAWPGGIFNVVPLDESAFSLTRNNGETWNQLSLIDTRINKLTDVAPSADCTTVYLASVNNGTYCQGFDSVWRSSTNEKVVAPPLPALPIGQVWERVYTHVTALTCNSTQSNYAILRLAPDKLDGQVVGWAAGGTAELLTIGGFAVGLSTKAMAWSPDFGDYWANMNPRIPVQDFAFETSTIVYVLDVDGNMQKMPYTGTAWSSTIQTVGTGTGGGHTIEAMAPDKVLVGNGQTPASPNPASISMNGGTSFIGMSRPMPNATYIGYHAIFDTDFVKNATIYVANDTINAGLVYRNTAPAGSNIDWTDMMTNMCFIGYIGPHKGYYGLVQTNSLNVTGQGTLYAAHNAQASPQIPYSGVERTLTPLAGIPKPGLEWTCLDAAASPYQATQSRFTLEPKSLKYCGCLTADTYTTLYAIDNWYYSDVHNVGKGASWAGYNAGVKTVGLLWEYTDCVAKKGPKLTLDDGAIIGCDPATGRNQEVNFRWEQLCIANLYQLQIAKDKAFTLGVYDSSIPVCTSSGPWGILPIDVTSPALVYFTNGGDTMPTITNALGTAKETQPGVPALECGHLYYWRVRVLDEVTLDAVNSPWSDVRNFTIKAGFRVTTPYYGPQLLSPDNGCACPCDTPIAFSWSPFKETTAYKIQISANADMSAPLEEDSNVISTAYMAKKAKFDCGKQYFWRVQAVKPAPSEWSASFAFSIQPRPAAPPAAPVPKEPTTPLWVWIVIAIGAILVIVTLVLIMKTRRA